jgi:glycosyltransferase involved in cell wall biosynthesis
LSAELPTLLSRHQQWVIHERVDIQADFDLSDQRDQARLLNWWLHHMRDEYGAPEESLGWGHLSSPIDPAAGPFATLVTYAMQKTYALREDVQNKFDISTRFGRVAFIDWFFRRGLFEDKLDETSYVHHILPELSSPATEAESKLPVNKFAALVLQRYKSEFKEATKKGLAGINRAFERVLNQRAPELLYLYRLLPDGVRPVNRKLSLPLVTAPGTDSSPQVDVSKGVNLIGYAHGAFGMGEHVKMAARALSGWSDKFSIVDVNAYAHARQPESDILSWSERPERYGTNIFHVNADVMAGALTTIGPSLGAGRYNIGYWAWELSQVPDAWQPSIDFVDEIWAPSLFIQEAFQGATNKPVVHMPLCVDLSFDTWKRRKDFGLPEDKFLFLYYFDSHSYYQRKNPFAALRAFKAAFADRQDVGLVIKTQNANENSPEWVDLLGISDGDPRIHILNQTMTKGEVLSLQVECDCFVSLHRSEGFGRGPAEAMWLGKPVIVTGYSGNMDFTLPDNSLLVDYQLVRVRALEYPFHRNQVWAQPDEDHAARQMRRLVDEPGLAKELGRRGAALMRTEYSYKPIGKRYLDRLKEIGAL